MSRRFAVAILGLIYIKLTSGILSNKTNDHFADFVISQQYPVDDHFSTANKCTTRLHTSLEKLRRRANLKSTAYIDLSGYALHQALRRLPLDMYVTDIRVRTPGVGDWVRIEKCQYSNRDNRMTTQILFNDLTVSGTIQLLGDNEILKNSFHPTPREFCKMSLRLQRAGMGINIFPTRGRSRGIEVRTEAKFMDPKFLSVHAYGCKLNDIFRRSEQQGEDEEYSTKIEAQPDDKYTESHASYDGAASRGDSERGAEENVPEVRIITLNPDIRTEETKWFSLHNADEGMLNDFHRNRIQGGRPPTNERNRLKAVLHVKKLIAQQVNHVFQTQGPFSQKLLFKPTDNYHKPSQGVLSTITELDENLTPIRPVQQRPFDQMVAAAHLTRPVFYNYYDEVSREMEDVFLRGIKTLLTRYVEKQLEIPLKEALMVNIGYTVSYG